MGRPAPASFRIAAEAVGARPRAEDGGAGHGLADPPKQACKATNGPTAEARTRLGADLKAMEEPQILSRLINWALTDLMLEHGEIVLMGEDVGRKGGVYGASPRS